MRAIFRKTKEAVFDQVDTLEVLLPAFTGMVGTMVFNERTPRKRKHRPVSPSPPTSPNGSSRTGAVPPRARAFWCLRQVAEGRSQELWDLTDNDFIEIFAAFLPADKAPGVREVLSTEGSVSATARGHGSARVREQIVSAKTAIEQLRAFANSVSDGPAYKTPESLLK